ncbi:hypothetical protein BU16DRAFT_420422, partial [Lophium mytilinum]
KYIKVSLMLKKRDEVTDEFFHQYWRGNHVDLAMANQKFMEKVVRYNQWHTSPDLKKQAAAFGIPVPDYDGIAEVWVKSIEDWVEIVSDPAFIETI